MPTTKKSTGAAAAPKKSTGSQLPYKDMIRETIISLKERNGVSRQALKKYIQGNFHPTLTGAQFDAAFNKALKTGVEKGDFTQPKGPSGPVKLAKKAAPEKKAKPATAAGEAKKATGATGAAAGTTTKKASTKSAATKTKTATTAKKPAAKTASTAAKPKKTTATTAKKANTGTKRKAPSSAPAVVEQKTVLNKTKSGRVSKGKEPTPGSTSAKRSAAGKKGAAKSPATKKATPAKAEA